MAVIDLANYALGQNDSQFEESDLSDSKDKFQVSESTQHLDMSRNRLSIIPNELSKLSNLQSIDLSENCFKSIPQVLQSMTSLVTMNLSNNSISVADHKTINLEEEFEFLKPKLANKLELSNPEDSIYSEEDLRISPSKQPNKSNSVDSGILLADHTFDFSSLTHLTIIDLSSNQIQFFPDSLAVLPNLVSLNMAHNQITTMPATLKSSHNLRYLDISWNRLVEVPMWVGELTKCIKLSLSGNPIGDAMEFPDHFGSSCRRIKYLEMENTHIRNFPIPLASLLDLRHLLLSNKKNSLVDIKSSGSFLWEGSWDFFGNKKYSSEEKERQSKDRLLHRNSLWTFPPRFSNLVGLVKLEAVDVGLADLPEALGKLRNLKILDVAKNNLSWIPKSFVELSSLEFCNFSQNSILMLPLDFETMPRLAHLLAANNMIAEVSENLHLLKSLRTLDLYENQISTIPNGIMNMDLIRLDLAQNDITEKSFQSQTSSDYFKKYVSLQAELRHWDGDLVENLKENYKLDTCLFHDREDFKTYETVDKNPLQPDMNDLLSIDEEEGVDFHGNADEDYIEHQDGENKEISNIIPLPDTEVEDWITMEPYSPPRVSYSHNLQRMDQEDWWGKGQFCPADQHATPRNEKILKNWERDRQMRMMRHVGRWGRREPPNAPLLREGQFDDV